jgi:uncharacterized protein (TIGR02391 family)
VIGRWDNIEILRAIDQEQQRQDGAPVGWSGQDMMKQLLGTFTVDPSLYPGFVQELHIARDAGLLTFTPPHAAGRSLPPDPSHDPNIYLQSVRNFALTVAGQDRARGRVVIQDLPDPDEDDGRLISRVTLKAVAAAINEEYEPEQASVFLAEAGAPPATLILPDTVEPHDTYRMLYFLAHESGSEGRRALRSFLGRWLDDRLPTGPGDELRASLIEQMARQGWHVVDGMLVVGEAAVGTRPTSPVLRDARLAALHPEVRRVAEPYVRSGHLGSAVFEVVKAVNLRVKKLAGKESEPDNASLMGVVFTVKGPLLELADLSTQTGRDAQDGYMHLFTGVLKAVRNPGAHEPFSTPSLDEALELLSLASMLMRRLDSARQLPAGP